MRVICYVSRSLLPAEKNYHSSKLEFLCLKWAICEHFRDYLYYAKMFEVYTDNNPLLYCMSTGKLNATTIRWVNELADFHFSIHYRPGRSHVDADSFSRMPLDIDSYLQLCNKIIDMDCVDAMMKSRKQIDVFSTLAHVMVNETVDIDSKISLDDSRATQMENKDMQRIIELVRVRNRPSAEEKRTGTAAFRALAKSYDSLSLADGVMFRVTNDVKRLVVPEKFRKIVYRQLHASMGHVGAERVYKLARERFYWPRMKVDANHYVTSGCPCLKDKRPHYKTRAPLVGITSSAPLELLSVDFLEPFGGYRYLLVIVDHFTRYAEVFPTRNKTAKTAASKLYDQFVLRYGFPERLHSDHGGEFLNQIWQEFSKICNIRKSQTTAYHPEGNGQCERFNRTLVQMLRTLNDDHKRNWYQHAQRLAHAYNCTVNDSTGFSPYFLLFGRNPRLPIDHIFEDVRRADKLSQEKFVEKWRASMREAYQKAGKSSKLSMKRSRASANLKSRSSTLQAGNRVLLRLTVDKKSHAKLRSYCEDDVYTFRRQIEGGPVYEIECGKAVKIVHRNMLLCCNSLPVVDATPA